MENKVENSLIELGIMPNLSGFDYICVAIKIIGDSKQKPKVGFIYGCIAIDFDSSVSKVERAMRHAFSRMDKNSDAYKKYLGISEKTNGALLFTLHNRLKED